MTNNKRKIIIEEYTKESIDYLKNTDIKKRKKLGKNGLL